jgi:predicted anti-sigma-YlaC factor YlaD
LTALLDKELVADEQKTVEAHLLGCPECQKEYDSLLFAFDLTEKVNSIPLNPAIWTQIQSEVTSAGFSGDAGPGAYLRILLTPRWRPVAVVLGSVAVVMILLSSLPSSGTDPALEKEFTVFIQEREAISRKNRRILFEPRQDRDDRGGNPFITRVSHERTNPFRR